MKPHRLNRRNRHRFSKRPAQQGLTLLELLIVLAVIGVLSVQAISFISFLRGRNGLETATETARSAIRAARRNALLGSSNEGICTFDIQNVSLPATVKCLTAFPRRPPFPAPVTTKAFFNPQDGNAASSTEPNVGWGFVVLQSEAENATTAIYISQRPGPVLVYKNYGRGWTLMENTVH